MAKPKRSSTANKLETAGGMTLDPMEVMKAMLAQKGKGKQVKPESDADASSQSEDDNSGDESSLEESEVEEESREADEEEEEEGSEAESSRSAELRFQRQSPPTSRIPTPTTSRVSQNAYKPESAFDSQTKPSADTTFESLGMSKPLISALGSINIKKPTEIQSACLGPIMSGRDCIGGAKTGSGKTLAFALPIVERIARDPFGVWAVVLTPTR
jgi:ATP-dependent RNA helicase DDX49/DBP8